jgi:hypothetical protein
MVVMTMKMTASPLRTFGRAQRRCCARSARCHQSAACACSCAAHAEAGGASRTRSLRGQNFTLLSAAPSPLTAALAYTGAPPAHAALARVLAELLSTAPEEACLVTVRSDAPRSQPRLAPEVRCFAVDAERCRRRKPEKYADEVPYEEGVLYM